MKHALLIFALLSFSSLAFASKIAPDPERNSGADATHETATPIDLERPVSGNVDWPRGDASDWYSIKLETAGAVDIHCVYTHPDAAFRFAVLDADKKVIVSQARTASVPLDKGEPPMGSHVSFVAEPGAYYILVHAPAASTDYTLTVTRR